MQELQFPVASLSFEPRNPAFSARLRLPGHLAFGLLAQPSDLLPKLDATVGSGEGGVGEDDMLRFDCASGALLGGMLTIPGGALVGDLPDQPRPKRLTMTSYKRCFGRSAKQFLSTTKMALRAPMTAPWPPPTITRRLFDAI